MRMIVTGGGTGGHLFPGIAVAEEMLRRFPQGKVLFVSTDRAIDNKTLADRAFEKKSIACLPLKGKSLLGTLKSMAQLPISLWQALRLVRAFKPQLVLGVGGYVTGPVVLAARLMGVKTCIHEQNSIPGMANRMLGKIVDQVYISIPGSEKFFPQGKAVLTGNPVRTELLREADRRKDLGAAKTVLVLGGSQGAHRVNSLMVEALAQNQSGDPVLVRHQTGNSDEAWVREGYGRAGVTAQVSSFISDMAAAYRTADLVVSRAGATTLAELAVLGKPAILIPFPYAADDHQTTNAAFLVAGGAALMFQERELDGPKLREAIWGLLNDAPRLQSMAARMKEFARPEATCAIVEKSIALLAA
ncbi:MAG: undecaprenyldiphospho-muramoylpentapeptide beta-N-acetylglucosaminyltransferase [Proteobacteria bacterium]|nr:undecaprenyldiphospho-muramoylpentapeptide beta-N-acetylglucosaminyltransferase [Pseudomonadota bacterium]MCG2823754.1 undecaprenyldiphospho-muramoylpentapeptide beta-N-acetylglucosaminyltransferase [Desulfobulbaceae bacterium]MDP2002974.1 undecaprenyldiphospho-muramoylpentapeptide beta-N-acetylglucosaminyltransferase [Desulfurivibrionaceae bacterium]MDP2757622.1 undecaprenyldiphospho-muramoylpentapeptide beta-N-acetylglucosaminyltransferase [Desulfurivibrionaceae bacterium]